MVGHTGKLEAAVKAVETIDQLPRPHRHGGAGRRRHADRHRRPRQRRSRCGIRSSNEPHTAHTCNPVPVILVDDAKGMRLREGGSLRDIAPTMLGMLGVEEPKEMTGRICGFCKG